MAPPDAPGSCSEDGGTCTVAVLVSNRASILPQVLSTIYQQAYERKQIHLIFCENSSDGSLMLLKEFRKRHEFEYASIRIFEKVEGIARSRNTCLASIKGGLLFFVDDDVLVPPQALAAISQTFRDRPDCGIAGIRYLPPGGDTLPERIPLVNRLTALPGMGCTGIRRSTVQIVGLFDESLSWGEDLDWVCRAKRKGIKVLVLPGKANHLNPGLSFRNSVSTWEAVRSWMSPRTLDAHFLVRYPRQYAPIAGRKYGPFIAWIVGMSLIPVSWVPAAAVTAFLWMGMQTVLRGFNRIWFPGLVLLSGILSVIGLARGLIGLPSAGSVH